MEVAKEPNPAHLHILPLSLLLEKIFLILFVRFFFYKLLTMR